MNEELFASIYHLTMPFSLPFSRSSLPFALLLLAPAACSSEGPAAGTGGSATTGGTSSDSGGGPAATGGLGSGGGPLGSGGDGLGGSGGDGSSGAGGAGAVTGAGGGSMAGGAPGTGGEATVTGGAPGAGGSAGGDPCATASLCDDFEGGMDPAWQTQPDSTPVPMIDSSKGANGSSSSVVVEVTSQQSFIAAPVPAQSFYVRTYMMLEKSTTMASGHAWFIVGADSLSQGSGAQMRFGASTNHGHAETDFNVYGSPSCSGEKTHFSDGANDAAQGWQNTTDEIMNLDADKWYCVEAFFNGDQHEFQLWVDDVEHEGFHVTADKMCPNWSPTYTHIKIGGGANGNFGKIWYDDVVVSTSRVGCK